VPWRRVMVEKIHGHSPNKKSILRQKRIPERVSVLAAFFGGVAKPKRRDVLNSRKKKSGHPKKKNFPSTWRRRRTDKKETKNRLRAISFWLCECSWRKQNTTYARFKKKEKGLWHPKKSHSTWRCHNNKVVLDKTNGPV